MGGKTSKGASESRPALAVGHVHLRARGVRSAAARLVTVGVRSILVRDDFAVLELRGGTHIVLRAAESPEVHRASFDFMVDDIDRAHQELTDAGFKVTSIQRGRIHDSFTALAPEEFRIAVVSSHAGDRPV